MPRPVYLIKRCDCTCAEQTEPCACGASCWLTMPSDLLDAITTPYADLSAAAAALAAEAAAGCYMQSKLTSSGDPPTRTLFETSFSSGVLTVKSDGSHTADDPETLHDRIGVRVYLTAAGGLSINHEISATYPGSAGPSNRAIELYESDASTLVDASYGSPPSANDGTFAPTIPADGYYWIFVNVFNSSDAAGTRTTHIKLECSGTGMVPCAVRAAYGGGPSYLVCS